MVKVSIIIVSYNVKYFLEQCLCSVEKAIGEWAIDEGDAEVYVVDNNSSDETIQDTETRFPFVQFIANTENTGFAKANNQALQMATGQYILFLNPDTILPEDFFVRCFDYMDKHPHTGALGVQMIDGNGKFLKESKRGYPTIWASFCKLSGLTAVFPASEFFAGYYAGHLKQHTNQVVQVLSGACMLLKKEALDKTGGFDERFFMYAEDIDLSYRMLKSGYANHYLADVLIIHFKGESTTKDIGYVKLFYKAMVQFVEKHYSGPTGILYAAFLKLAIGLRALFAVAILRLTRPTPKWEKGSRSIFLQGDKSNIEKLKTLLPTADHTSIVQGIGEANEIIFCEGELFSFREIIKAIKSAPGQHYKIHACRSLSVVGSNGYRGIDNVIVLSNHLKLENT